MGVRYKEGTRKVQGRYKESSRIVSRRLRGVDVREGEGKGGRSTHLFENVKAVGYREGFSLPTIQGLSDFFF